MRKMRPLLHIREDNRGKLIELFKGRFVQGNLLIMKKGSIWGNHYHKKTTEYFYVFRGKLSVSFLSLKDKKRSRQIFKTGSSFTIKPYNLHTVRVIKPSQCLILYSRQFNQKDPDLYQLPSGR